jgi:hypothetical protein
LHRAGDHGGEAVFAAAPRRGFKGGEGDAGGGARRSARADFTATAQHFVTEAARQARIAQGFGDDLRADAGGIAERDGDDGKGAGGLVD